MTTKSTDASSNQTPADYLPWLITSAATLLALGVWAGSLDWRFGNLSIYQIFPVLGLVAYSIMWSHYISSFLNNTLLKTAQLKDYFRLTGYAVLVLILLHPGLFIYQRFRDGFGLPPESYKSYVAPSLAWITVLGSVSLTVFLAYELHRWFKDRKWWKYIVYLDDAAMLAIFYHGLRLGTQLHIAWFRYVWWFYGISLVGTLLYAYILGDRLVKKNQTVSIGS